MTAFFGLVLVLYPGYVNQGLAKADLRRRMGMDLLDFETISQNMLHTTGEGSKITKKLLKIRASYNSRQAIFDGFLECLKRGTKAIT